jgi:hypothetical protein
VPEYRLDLELLKSALRDVHLQFYLAPPDNQLLVRLSRWARGGEWGHMCMPIGIGSGIRFLPLGECKASKTDTKLRAPHSQSAQRATQLLCNFRGGQALLHEHRNPSERCRGYDSRFGHQELI